MKIKFSLNTIQEYLNRLSSREPVPGGGSAAALSAAMGVALLCMVTHYSIDRKSNTKVINKKFKTILRQSEEMRSRLLELSSLDSQAYLAVAHARGKDIKTQKIAAKGARLIPAEVCKLCYKSLQSAPYLVKYGNPYLLSDVEVAIELLLAGFNSAHVMVRINS